MPKASLQIDGMHERPYEKLIVWKEAHQLCLEAYALTVDFPLHERFCLGQQIRKSAYSVPMNIAEGNSRRTAKDKAKFMDIAQASLEELHYQLLLARDLKYLSPGKFVEMDGRIQKVSYLLIRFRQGILKTF